VPATARPHWSTWHRRSLLTLSLVAFGVWVADLITKSMVVAWRADKPPLQVVGTWLQIVYTRNSGAAFSVGTGMTVLFSLVAVVVIVVIVRTSSRLASIGWAIALGGLLGGALGNLTDRLFRSPGLLRGSVVDWIQVPHYPVFNLADSAIVCSAVLMVILSLRGIQIDGTRHT
jgi:signal peptidase II